MWSKHTRLLIESACEEDLGPVGDITSALLGEEGSPVTARVVPRHAGVICGLALAPAICETFAARLRLALAFAPATREVETFGDGDLVEADTCVATLRGPRPAVLAAERTLLNFLGRLSGVATLTRRYVDAAQRVNPSVHILDTRKTIPGWRELDKYAVRAGGGHNHRSGLFDAILIKDNHLAGVPTSRLAARLFELLNRCRGLHTDAATPPAEKEEGTSHLPCLASGDGSAAPAVKPAFVEVEIDDPAQLAQVCKVIGVDIVLLDNFSLEQMGAAVVYRDECGLRGKLALEASGGITLDNVADIAATGVDRISIGALTHSAPNLDIGLDL
ncbi:MAG: nicotinate-nucleotide diphosphorylase [Planctomycetes bacterium]|nr:nicotinate-nucleotide diphosphorylase [Planctomycetota bacterium]